MGKKNNNNKYEKVLELLKKQTPALTVKQEKFCNSACVERFLKAKGDSVKKAAKHIRNCLAWRDSISLDNLMADEFYGELAEGAAYVAGQDHHFRPVMIFRIKQDYHKFHSHKLFTRLLAFTLEVAIQTMPENVDQFVILFDASFFRSASAFMNMLVPTLKIIADYYPSRLHKAFLIDPPSLFPYLWKGVKPFMDLSPYITMVSSMDYEEPLELKSSSMAKVGSCASSRFSFTVSHHFDSVKPWYLTVSDTSASGPTISPLNARSLSFASPIGRKGFFPSTPMPQKTQKVDPSMIHQPRTPKASFLHSPALLFKRDKDYRGRGSFTPYLKFYRRPYDETVYRSKMRPPLAGIISIINGRHVSNS